MPQLREFLQLSLLALAVPLQLYFSGYFSADSGDNYALRTNSNVLQWRYWQQMCTNLMDKIAIWRGIFSDGKDAARTNAKGPDDSETDAYDSEADYKRFFGTSDTPRSPRPAFIHYHVGQVVRHRDFKFRGVIIGWDERARAPSGWTDSVYHNRPELASIPHYKVLVDTRDRRHPQFAYIAQDLVELLNDGTFIVHPEIDDLFESFKAAAGVYIPRPRLQMIYPHDNPRRVYLPTKSEAPEKK